MAWLASGMVLATMAARVTVLLALVMVSLAPALLVPLLALLLLLLLPLLPALVLAGTRAQRPEQLKTRRARRPHEALGLVRGWQQLPRLQGAAAAAEA